jgi:hypothetical protein
MTDGILLLQRPEFRFRGSVMVESHLPNSRCANLRSWVLEGIFGVNGSFTKGTLICPNHLNWNAGINIFAPTVEKK